MPYVPEADAVVAAIADAGYEGTELGPPGYLGEGDALRARFADYGVQLAGGYIPIRFSEPDQWDEDLAAMRRTLDLFSSAGGTDAKAVLADAGSEVRTKFPGRAATDPSIGLDEAGWKRLADGVSRAADLARSKGFEPTFHHHTATFVEAPWEIERLLELTDVPLLLDTGHLALGGGDPTEALRAWAPRINHVHIKDVREDILEGVIADGADMPEAWRRGVFCALGEGDVDFDPFFAELKDSGYSGWIVVEQDMVPSSPEDAAEAIDAQRRNRKWLRSELGV